MGEEERPGYHLKVPILRDPVSGIPLPMFPKPDVVAPAEASIGQLLNPKQNSEPKQSSPVVGLPSKQEGENQTSGGSGIRLSSAAKAEWDGWKDGPRVAWGPPLELDDEIDKAFEQGRIPQEDYDEVLEDRRLREERKRNEKPGSQ